MMRQLVERGVEGAGQSSNGRRSLDRPRRSTCDASRPPLWALLGLENPSMRNPLLRSPSCGCGGDCCSKGGKTGDTSVFAGAGVPMDTGTRQQLEEQVASALGDTPLAHAEGPSLARGASVTTPDHPVERQADKVSKAVSQGKGHGPASAAGGPSRHVDFGHVRIFTGERAANAAAMLGARAFTFGSDIVFGRDQYAPTIPAGRALLAHELAHVLQQSRTTRSPTMPIMRQACRHDGPPPECGAGGLGWWRVENVDTGEQSRLDLDDLVVDAMQTHFGGRWLIQVQSPPNLAKRAGLRDRADGVKVTVGSTLGLEVVEVKSCGTQFGGGCLLAATEANGYVAAYQGVASELVTISSVRSTRPDLRMGRTELSAAQRRELVTLGVDLSVLAFQHAWRVYHSIETKLGTPLPALTAVTVRVSTDGSLNTDYLAGPPIIAPCRVRGRPGVKSRQLKFQVNKAGGASWACWNTPCTLEDENQPRQHVQPRDQPQQEEQETAPEERQPTVGDPTGDQPPVQDPGISPTVPVLVGTGVAGAAGLALLRRRARQAATRRLAIEAARRAQEQFIKNELRKRAILQQAFGGAARTGARTTATGAAARAAGKAAIYAELAAAVVLLASGRAEARPGPGESALETLFRAMADNGTPPSPQLRRMIEEDPRLREVLERAAQGDARPGSEEATRRLAELLREHGDELTDEELELIAQVGGTAGGSGRSPESIEELRAALAATRARRSGREQTPATGTPGAGRGGAGGPETTTEGTRPTTPTQQPAEGGAGEGAGSAGGRQPEQPRLPEGVPDAVRQQIDRAPQPVQDVIRAMIGSGGRGPRVTEENVRRIVEALPTDLTPEQATRLIERVQPAQTDSIDEIVARLRAAVEAVRRGPAEPGEGTDDVEADAPPQRATQEPQPTTEKEQERHAQLEEYRRRMVEAIQRFNWTNLGADDARVVLSQRTLNFRTARVGERGDALWVTLYTRGGPQGTVRAAAQVQIRIRSRSGGVMQLVVIGAGPFVSEVGAVLGTLQPGAKLNNVAII